MDEFIENLLIILWAGGAMLLVVLPLSAACGVFALFLQKYKKATDTEQKSKYKFRAIISGIIAAFVLLVYVILALIFMQSIAYM